MKPIQNEFDGTRDQGKISEKLPAYRFKMLKRSGMTCLFEKSRGGTGPKSYEVVILQQCQKKTWPDGRVTEAHEKMPKPEDWGTLGWTYLTLDEAMRKFRYVSGPEPEKFQK
jgi:hypothetical protein